MDEKCETCLFYFEPQGDNLFGTCRHRSPIISMKNQFDIPTHFPEVYEDDWCGDYESVKNGNRSRLHGGVNFGDRYRKLIDMEQEDD